MTRDSLIGRQLANFRVDRLIGRGGMAQVYYGWDVKLERPVAIKVIDARYRHDPSYAERFVREARAVASWRHENIIQIHYADDQDGLYYFAMEYIEGLNLGVLLSEYATEGKLMPHDDVLRIGRAIASALDYAHQKDVIHRDVKPSNVMVASNGRVVLTDFGLAMDIQQGTLGQVFGSSQYIAPEQARCSADAVPQSDLYALGVVFYEMLTGVVPFDDPSPTTVAVQHLTLPPPPPRKVNPNLNPESEAVLLKALSKSPEERYQTGSTLLDALEKALQTGHPASIKKDKLSSPPAGVRLSAGRSLSKISVGEKVSRHLQTNRESVSRSDSSHQMDDSLIGQRLDEYRIDALLGRGGMARVYRGLDEHLRRYVAIKVIDAPFRTDSDYVMRFEREAQAIAQMEHPNIVRLYRYGKAEGQLYMAMQYVEGADLGSVLDSYREDQEFIELKEACQIVRQVCLALDYAHSHGVIHRDVKPSNIMLDQQGNVILTDFGLALLTELGTQGEIFGSPHYIAPEQAISSASVVPQSDLYAVGVILYEMCTGELPFDAEETLDIAMLHMTEPPRPPRELRSETSPELEAVILKTLAKEPKERYQNGAELADALERAVQRASIKAPSISGGTASRLSIPDRVAFKSADRSLPPIPVGVVLPPPQPSGTLPSTGDSSVAGTPGEPAESSPSSRASGRPASLPEPSRDPVTDRTSESKGHQAGTSSHLSSKVAGRGRGMRWVMLGIILAGLGGILVCGIAALVLMDNFDLWDSTLTEASVTTKPATVAVVATSEPTFTPTHTSTPSAIPVNTQTPTSTPTSTGTPTASPTSTMTFTPTPSPTSTPTSTRLPTATFTPTETVTPSPTPSIPPGPENYELLIAKKGEESLFVVNQTGEAFPLAPLRLGDGKNAINGTDWEIDELQNEACVTAWKDTRKSQPPEGITCDQVGKSLTCGKRERFWKESFNVYYDKELIGTCKKDQTQCPISIPVK